MIKLTIIIPVYNEIKTIEKLIKKILKINIKKQLIIVDDGSSDGTRLVLTKYKNRIDNLIFHKKNLGKGAAIQTAKKFISGDIVLIQDADLEYDPQDYTKLIKPIINGDAQVVYGSRVLGKKRYFVKNFSSIYRIFFNHVLTIFSNVLNKQELTDAHTCYKVFSTKLFNSIELRENGFSFCPEITTKISKMNISIIEIPIAYHGRSYKEGKKIKVSDGFEAIITILKYKF